MKEGLVLRQRSTPLGTPGRLTLGNFSCDTLELPWRDNQRSISCIKADTYEGWVWRSPTFKRLVIRLEDKHGRFDCLIHNGNFAAEERDIDGDGDLEVTQVHGCTLVGRGFGDIPDKSGDLQWGIKSSGPTLEALIDSLEDAYEPGGYHRVLITYAWAEGCEP